MSPREQLGFAVRLVGVAAAAAVVLWLVVTLRALLLVVTAALVVAAGLGRPSNWLERRGAPRVVAAGTACLTLVAVLVALSTAVLVSLADEVEWLLRILPDYRDAAVRALEDLERALPVLPPIR